MSFLWCPFCCMVADFTSIPQGSINVTYSIWDVAIDFESNLLSAFAECVDELPVTSYIIYSLFSGKCGFHPSFQLMFKTNLLHKLSDVLPGKWGRSGPKMKYCLKAATRVFRLDILSHKIHGFFAHMFILNLYYINLCHMVMCVICEKKKKKKTTFTKEIATIS